MCAYIDVRQVDREIEVKIEMIKIGINRCVLNIHYFKKKERKKNTKDVIYLLLYQKIHQMGGCVPDQPAEAVEREHRHSSNP